MLGPVGGVEVALARKLDAFPAASASDELGCDDEDEAILAELFLALFLACDPPCPRATAGGVLV